MAFLLQIASIFWHQENMSMKSIPLEPHFYIRLNYDQRQHFVSPVFRVFFCRSCTLGFAPIFSKICRSYSFGKYIPFYHPMQQISVISKKLFHLQKSYKNNKGELTFYLGIGLGRNLLLKLMCIPWLQISLNKIRLIARK